MERVSTADGAGDVELHAVEYMHDVVEDGIISVESATRVALGLKAGKHLQV